MLKGERYAVDLNPDLYNIPNGAILVAHIRSHPTTNETQQFLYRGHLPNNFDLHSISTAENYAKPGRITVDTANFRGFILHANVANEQRAPGYSVDVYLKANHDGNYDVSDPNKVVVYENEVKDWSIPIGG